MVKLFAMLMALLMSAGVSSGEIDPGHVDLDITDYGAQITFEDGTGYWLEFRQTQNSAIRLEEVDYLETEELFLSEMEENGLTNYELYDSSELTCTFIYAEALPTQRQHFPRLTTLRIRPLPRHSRSRLRPIMVFRFWMPPHLPSPLWGLSVRREPRPTESYRASLTASNLASALTKPDR